VKYVRSLYGVIEIFVDDDDDDDKNNFAFFYPLWIITIEEENITTYNKIFFGISSTALSWIKSYLLNRSFYVNIKNYKSSVFQLLSGVPQRSVLGTIAYSEVILYIIPLCTVIKFSSKPSPLQIRNSLNSIILSFIYT